MKARRFLAATPALLAAVFGSAASALTPPPGVELPADWEATAQRELKARLKDPYSAVVQMTRGPRYADHKIDLQGRIGWAVCFSVNGKNSYGGYTGAQTEVVVITPGGTATVISGDALRSQYAASVVRMKAIEECNRRADQPPNPKEAI